MTVTRVTVNSSLSSPPTITSLTPVLTTTIPPIVDVIPTKTTLDPPVKIVPATYGSTMTPDLYSSELDQSYVNQDGSAQLKPKSQDNQLWSDHDVVTLLDAALASFAAIQPAWIPIVVTLLTGKCFISVTMHSLNRFRVMTLSIASVGHLMGTLLTLAILAIKKKCTKRALVKAHRPPPPLPPRRVEEEPFLIYEVTGPLPRTRGTLMRATPFTQVVPGTIKYFLWACPFNI